MLVVRGTAYLFCFEDCSKNLPREAATGGVP